MGVERRLVDLDAEAGPLGKVEHAALQPALGRGDRRGEKTLGGKSVCESRVVRPALSRRVCATCAAAAIPTGPSSALER